MLKDEDMYKPYFEHNKTIAQVLSLFSGFIFTSITLLLTRLNNTEDVFAQATLLFLTILFYITLFVLIDNLEMPFHYIKDIPSMTLKVRPFFFYVFISFALLGSVFWGLQRSPESVLLGYRIFYASLALLPATWFWFFSELFNQKPRLLTWVMTGVGMLLAVSALFGKGPMFFGLPLEPDPISLGVGRPQSIVLKLVIQGYCLVACILYTSLIFAKPLRLKEWKQ
jgi:hypothetical protein